jgi:glutamate:GABA antiporter
MISSESHAPALRRELRLRDLVFFDICAVVSLRWVAAAAHAGPGSFVLWIIAALFFFLPSAITVSSLSRRMPEEGGMYIWTKTAFGDQHAFLCGWFYFISNVMYLPSLLLAGISMTAYAFGELGQRVAEDRGLALSITLAVLWAAFAANFFGMKVAKWISAFGGVSTFVIGAALAALAIVAAVRYGVQTRFDLLPKVNFDTVNFWSQIAFAFVGLELAPIVSGDLHRRHCGTSRAINAEPDQPYDGPHASRSGRRTEIGSAHNIHSAGIANWNRFGRPAGHLDRRKYPFALRCWAGSLPAVGV